MMAAFKTSWLQTKLRWRRWRVRVRREQLVLALLALLTLGPGESLMCIIHCDLWLPSAFGHYFGGGNPHQHHHHGQAMADPAADHTAAHASAAPGVFSTAPAESGARESCFMAGSTDGMPFHVPPSPIHDVLPVLLLLIVVFFAVVARPRAPPRDPPSVFVRPPLRPPIPFAA
jgi:hypothetical protein